MAKKKTEKEYTNTPVVNVTDEITSEQYEVFRLVTKEGRTYIVIDKYVMTQDSFESVEAAKKYIDSKPWKLIINAACCLMELSNKNK